MAIVTTSPYQIDLFLRSHIDMLPANIHPVLFSNTSDQYSHLIADMDVTNIPISRAGHVSFNDVSAASVLRSALRTQEVQSVVTMSPKGGFVGQIGAVAAGVERRLHIFTGQVWEGLDPGVRRFAVLSADRIVGRLATSVAVDSPSQARRLTEVNVVSRGTPVVVPHPPGSIRGVDIERFRPSVELRLRIRRELGLPENAIAFVQLGRIDPAKGIPELVEAFKGVRAQWRRGQLFNEPRLFLVGEDEAGMSNSLQHVDGLDILPFTERPERVLAAMDVITLVSHREGFGSTVIEGAATGLPAIGTDIVGVRDAIVDGETGWLVPKLAPIELQSIMTDIVQDRLEISRRGTTARHRAIDKFDSHQVTAAWIDLLIAFHEGEL